MVFFVIMTERYRRSRLVAAIIGSCVIAGCARGPTSQTLATTNPLVPDAAIKLSETTSVPLEKLVFWGGYAALAYLILDPLAPNWDIEEAAFPDNRYYMTLRMKRYYAGGAGEARMTFHQRAGALMLRAGFDRYEVLEYKESVESSMLGSQRTARGVISLTKLPK